MVPVATCDKSIEEKDTLVAEQNILVEIPTDELKKLLYITVATGIDIILHAGTGDVLALCMIGSETFFIHSWDVQLFIEDCSLESSNDMSSLISEESEIVLETVAEMVPQLFVKISGIEAECAVNDAPVENVVLAVLPY